MDRNIAVYAGTFDPITNGHLDIVKRATRVFSKVVVAVANNRAKDPLFAVEERMQLARDSVAEFGEQVSVTSFSGLLVNHCRELGAAIIIRGLRAVSDYEYESQMAMTNRQLSSEVETVFLMTSKNCSFISASIVRDIARHGGELSTFVPENVQRRLEKLYSNKK